MDIEKFSLSKKSVLITGSSGLLGIQHAAAILKIGGNVVLTDINKSNLLDVTKNLSKVYDEKKLISYVMDVTKKEDIINVFHKIKKENIRIDVLINNAAIDPKVVSGNEIVESSRLESFELEQWNKQLEVGLTGAFLCSQIFGHAMSIDGKGGVILNIASDLSVISPDQRLYKKNGIDDDLQPVKPVTYSVIKTGLIGLTKYLSTYWAHKGVRCNALSPGGIYNQQDKEFINKLENLIPLGRMANKNEYQSTIQYLCSDASAYMNGQNIIIDGGRTVW